MGLNMIVRMHRYIVYRGNYILSIGLSWDPRLYIICNFAEGKANKSICLLKSTNYIRSYP